MSVAQPSEIANVAPEAASDGELDLRAVGRTLWRKKWWIVAPALIAAMLATVGVHLVTPKYKSETRILIEARDNVFFRPEADKAGDRASVDAEAVTSQVQLVLSRDLARQVIRQLKLNERPEFDPVLRGIGPLSQVLITLGIAKDPLRMSPEERVLEAYYERVTAFPVDKSRVIAVEFSSTDPELAARIANTVAEVYLSMSQQAKQDQTRAASKWLSGEIDSLRQKVSEAEARVEEFRAKSNLFVGPNNTTLSNQTLGEVNSQLVAARAQKSDAEAKARQLRDMLRQGTQLEAGDIINSELIRRLAEQRATLRAQLAEQSSTLLGQHPRIKELRAQIADLERQSRTEAEKLVRSFENDARLAKGRMDELSANLDQLKRVAGSSNEQEVQLRALEREAKAQRDLLESYLAKYREATARDSLGAAPADARVISRAAASNTPYFPKKLPIIMIATLATLLMTAGFIVTGELLAGNVYRPVVAAYPMAPGIVPQAAPVDAPWPAAGEGASPPAAAAPSMAAEPDDSIGAIAAELREAGDAGRRIVVAGAERSIGASSVAIALARRLARDRRVVIVDLALSAPSLAAISTDPSALGIRDLIGGAASFSQVITRDKASRAHVVAAGQADIDKAGAIASERLAVAIDALARSYDHVVIDAGVAAGIPLARFARLAPKVLLVATGMPADRAAVAGELLQAAGFTDVMMYQAALPSLEAKAAEPVAA